MEFLPGASFVPAPPLPLSFGEGIPPGSPLSPPGLCVDDSALTVKGVTSWALSHGPSRCPAARVPQPWEFKPSGEVGQGLGRLEAGTHWTPLPDERRRGEAEGTGHLLLLWTVICLWPPVLSLGSGRMPSCASRLSSRGAGQLLLQRFILGSEGFFEDTAENQRAAGRLLGTDGWGDGGSGFHCETALRSYPG